MALSSDLVARLKQLAHGFDRSWSFSDRGVEERALFFLPVSAAPELCDIARQIDFDPAGIHDFENALPGADAVGLAVGQSGSVRLYLQYWDKVARRVDSGDLGPVPLYLGIKRFADGSARRDVYFCLPLAPVEEYRPEIESTLLRFGADPVAVARMLDRLTPETCIWTRTQNSGRRSWLATVRRADIPSDLLAAALAPLAAREGVGQVIAALQHGAPLHIAGGEDAVKGAFLTFYVETDEAGIEDFLRRMGQ